MSEKELLEGVKEGDIEKVRFLCEKEYVDVNCEDEKSMNKTPLHYAAFYGHFDLVRYFHEAGGKLNSETKLGETPLFLACQEGNLEIVKYIIREAGEDLSDLINKQTKLNGDTPLHIACEQAHFRIALFLILKGASVSIKNTDGKVAKECAPFELQSIFDFCSPQVEKKSVDFALNQLEEEIAELYEQNLTLRQNALRKEEQQKKMNERASNEEQRFMKKKLEKMMRKYKKAKKKISAYKDRINQMKDERDQLKLNLKEKETLMESHMKALDAKSGDSIGKKLNREIMEKRTMNQMMGKELSEKNKRISHLKELLEIKTKGLKEKDVHVENLERQLTENGFTQRCTYCKAYDVAKWLRCSKCKALYCSAECQKADWMVNHHRVQCEIKQEQMKKEN